MKEQLKEETHYARQLYLHGAGTIKPVKNMQRLSELSGVPMRTLRDHVKGWRVESEHLALSHPDSPYSIALSDEVLTQHRKHVDFLKKQVDTCGRVVKTFTPGTQPYYVSLDRYIAALKKWEESSGIKHHHDAVGAAMRESAKTKARVAAKNQDGTPAPKRVVDRSKFDVDG